MQRLLLFFRIATDSAEKMVLDLVFICFGRNAETEKLFSDVPKNIVTIELNFNKIKAGIVMESKV
jgi:hypothetical protein